MNNAMNREIHEGINGAGAKVWMIVSIKADGSWGHVERFDNEAEAKHWMSWA